nr:uncharacterized protein LOC123746672 [Procambarus clarkii]
MKPAERSDTAAPAVSISKDGCHVSRGGAVVLGFLFVTATVATGLLAYHFSPGTTTVPEPAASDSEVPLRSSYPRQASVVAQGSEEVDIRLPTALKPLHYVVKLQPFINGNFSIVGYVEIEIEVLEPTSNITLHILDIITKNETIKVVPSDDVNGTGIEVQQNLYDNDRQFYTGVLAEELEVGRNYILSMQFLGYLNDELRGFYRSTYTDLDGNARLLASTQFEATDARRAFPCFDEPAMKATFEIFLAREASMSSISNMPKYETFPVEGQEGWEWDHFNTSVPMSTYLVAFVVSDFVHADSNVNDHVLFRVWAREAALQQAAYALQTGPEVLTFYEEYFSILFPLPKQDMIAIPDFSAGAMENWGLITYREEDFLYDPAVSPASSRQRVAIVVAHELAHQWFGNLVTPVWWTDIWLNEGFATFMEYTGTDHIEPSWKMWEQFVSDVVQTVLELDSLESSHPISIPVGRPEEINQIFDDISYSKGSAVIRMMNYFLTETTFRKGITNYLNGQAYSNAEQDDLWRYLTEAAHEDGTLPPDTTVKMIMDTWTLQMGYPVINVQRSADGTVATITQERFLLVKSANSSDTHDYKWWVPLTFTTQDDPNFNNSQAMVWWMKDSEPEITISSLPGKDQWVIFNLQETGYYRVNYDEDNWNLLIQQLNTDHQVIHVINRAQIIDDAMDLAHAGQLSYNITIIVTVMFLPGQLSYNTTIIVTVMFLPGQLSYNITIIVTVMFLPGQLSYNITIIVTVMFLPGQLSYNTALSVNGYLKAETEYIAWNTAMNNLAYLEVMFTRTGGYGALKRYLLSLLTPLYDAVGFDDNRSDPQLDQYKRVLALSGACSLEYQDCVDNSVSLFQEWMLNPSNNSIVSANLKGTVYCTAIAAGGEEEWNFAWGQYLASNLGSDKATLLSALGCTKQIWILSRYLDMAFTDGSGIRRQDAAAAFSSVSRNDIGRDLAWNYLRDQWQKISNYLVSFTALGDLILTATNEFNTNEEMHELELFKEEHADDLDTAARAIDQAIERTANNIAWMSNNYDVIVQWLDDQGFSSQLARRPPPPALNFFELLLRRAGTEDAAGIPPLDCHTEKLDNMKPLRSSYPRQASVVAQGSEEVDIRLPTALKPLHYVVKLQPFINGNFSIVGYVEIEMEVLEPTSNITLHILDIITKNETIKVVPSDDVNGTGIEVQQNLYDNDRQFYTGVLAEELEVGRNYILSMQFLGYLNDELVGFYRSTYTDEDGNTRLLASTQFESTDARRAFPCFDEPAMKATFEIFLAREASMSSISNMPKYETFPVEGQEGWEWDHFNTSVPMSTYLVAFVVSDFAHVDSNFNDHVLFRVWAREAAIEQADYAINTGPEVLTFYEEYFSIPFPLPKQDMCAIPAFTGGAMENWGLIIYSESSLLFDPAVSSAHDQQQVVVVISHELAHQWFGNLVTPDWWTDLWLNEGFASFMENVGTNHIEPSWRMWDQFVSNDLQDVLELDSLESSHPISIPVGSPSEIDQIFDDISYSKGSSVIRMMYNFLTESTFRKGITNYLNGQKYSNAEQDDLWRYLTEAAHEDGTLPPDTTVKMIMDTWTLQMGYPVIEVVRSADGTSATLTQERFLLVKSANSSDTHDYKWWVPLTYTSQDDPNFNNTQAMEWMKDSEPEITISSLPGKDQWVIFNLQETGYYRVNYDEDNWNLLIQQLNTDHQVIHVINRAQIIDDAMDLAHAGQLSYNTALSVNGYLKAETEYIAWNTAINNLAYLEMMFTRTGGYGALKRYLLSLLTPLYDAVGFDDNRSDPQLDQYKRVLALSGACSLEYQDCVDNSVSLFQEWMLNPTNNSIVSANLKGTVYCTAIAAGGEEEWNFAWGQYLASNLGSDKATLLSALGCTKQIWILSRYLDMAFSADSGILKRDAPSVFRSIASNDVGRDLAWSYLRDQFEHILDYIGVVSKVGDLVVAATNEFNTNEEKHELELFREEHGEELGGAVQAVDQAIENTANNIAWMDYNYDVIVQWLEDQGFSSQFGR